MLITNYDIPAGLFMIEPILHPHSILDFGAALSRCNMYSRRYWLSWTEHIDIPTDTILDAFDLFGTCRFPIYRKVYSNILTDLDELSSKRYDLIVLTDVIPYLDTDILSQILVYLKQLTPNLLIQLPASGTFPAAALSMLGCVSLCQFSGYDYALLSQKDGDL